MCRSFSIKGRRRGTHDVWLKKSPLITEHTEKSGAAPRISSPIRDYLQDRPKWIDQSFSHGTAAASRDIFCYQCYTNGRYSLECLLLYGHWEEVISNFDSSTSFEQEQVPRNSMQIALFAKQTAGNNCKHSSHPAATINRGQCSTSRSHQILSRPSECARDVKLKNNDVNLLDEATRPVPDLMDDKNIKNLLLLKKT